MNEYTITTETISQIIADIPSIRGKGEPSYEFKIWSQVLDKILQNYYGKYSIEYLKIHDTLFFNPIFTYNTSNHSFDKGLSFDERMDIVETELRVLRDSLALSERYMHILVHDNESFPVLDFVSDVEQGNANGFAERLESFFSQGNYAVMGNAELYFQNVINTIFRLMGFYTEVEHNTTDGRIDQIVKTANYIYIIEFKLDQSATEALRQIDEKEYAKPFENDARKIIKIGINFSSKTKRINDWKITE